LSDPQIFRLVSLGRRVESHYRRPMDIEWCMESGEVFVVQARPITTGLAARPNQPTNPKVAATAPAAASMGTDGPSKILLKGLGASPGLVVGTVRLLRGVEEMERLQAGEVLVTTMTMPDMVPAMSRAGAIITDRGE
ncbi:Pyruvate phosphate dikinase, PEP/pyruvate-binding domain protein, partial [mine drainage metagenome]